MTEEQIKEMLNGIINNGEKWECRPTARCAKCYPSCALCDWRPYKLGDEIHADWEYRKVNIFVVYENSKGYEMVPISQRHNENGLFCGLKAECEKWIKEHTKKSWLKEKLNDYWNLNHTVCEIFSNDEKGTVFLASKDMAKEVCKKILEEADNRFNHSTSVCSILEDIIKDLGIKV